MALVTFFEKTGCINNTKQKRILELAGHQVNAINLIHHAWTIEDLLSFFDGMEVKDWFNKNAPAITSGELHPEDFTEESALDALLQNHLLIRRPLLVIEGKKIVGFDKTYLNSLIGLESKEEKELKSLLTQDLSLCPQKAKNIRCD